jgi:hypothetical protein
MVIQMDSVSVGAFVVGALFTLIVFIFNGAFDKVERWDNTNLLIDYCEVELPRNQGCKLVAVPKESDDG